MDRAQKAALLSVVVFPGAGQFFLKKYIRGATLIIPFLIGCGVLGWIIVSKALDMIQTAPFQKGTVNAATVFDVTSKAVESLDLKFLGLILILLLLLWVLSALDAYRLGKAMDSAATSSDDQQSASPRM
ncbi:MAG TPA: hypothetical protein PK090_04860 [Smithellaceae bacterium]|nr:hypothetical protein [Smithellaceae bacterium]